LCSYLRLTLYSIFFFLLSYTLNLGCTLQLDIYAVFTTELLFKLPSGLGSSGIS
ncbi:hypothetical protein L9F63_008834, partial [Diploptera punctata]